MHNFCVLDRFGDFHVDVFVVTCRATLQAFEHISVGVLF